MNMNTFRVEALVPRQFKQRFEDITTCFGGTRPPSHTKVIATTGNFHIQAVFDLSKVLIELAAQVGQTLIVGGLENDVP